MKELRSCRARGGDSGPGTGAAGPGELAAEIAPLTLSRDLDGAMGESSCEVMDWRRMCGCVRDRELMCDMVGAGRRRAATAGKNFRVALCCLFGRLPLSAAAYRRDWRVRRGVARESARGIAEEPRASRPLRKDFQIVSNRSSFYARSRSKISRMCAYTSADLIRTEDEARDALHARLRTPGTLSFDATCFLILRVASLLHLSNTTALALFWHTRDTRHQSLGREVPSDFT